MYYYCKRTTMSASTAWSGAEGPQSCCGAGGGGGGGGGGLVNGNGGVEISEARAIGEWESATCDSADVTRSTSTDTRDREDGAARRLSLRCSAAPGGGEDPGGINIDGADGGVWCPRCTGETRTAAAAKQRGECKTMARESRSSEAAVNKRRGCSYSGDSKRACFSGTNTAEKAALHRGRSELQTGTGLSGEALAGNRQSRDETFKQRQRGDPSQDAGEPRSLSFTCETEGGGGVINGERRGCRTAKGRVRLCRVRSFLASGFDANGTPVAQVSDHVHFNHRTQQKAQFSMPSSPGALSDVSDSGARSPPVNGRTGAGVAGDAAGSWLRQIEAAQVEARKLQVQLGERTDMLWRRLHAVQVEQVERHVTQQLGDLRRAAVTPNSSEISRLARRCCDALRTVEGALDSDHTASSSGGGSDSEEEEEEGRRGRHVSPSRGKSVCVSREWQWMQERAWLGSRWVWLQAQVSELEYGIRALTELYTHLRQGKVSHLRAGHSVPETPLRAPRPFPTLLDCRFRKKLTEDSAPSPPIPHSSASSAARVRLLLRPCRHRLIRLEACPALGSKAVTLPCCCEPPAVCVLCGPPHPPAQEKSRWTCPNGLDQHIHPVLSMPSDFPVVVRGVVPPLAGLQPHTTVRWMERRGQGHQKGGRVRRRLMCPRPPSTLPPLFHTSGGSTCRSQRAVVSPGLLPQHVTDYSNLPGVPAARDTPTQMRRRRGESSFDIDNLVMPVGLAGLGARVQKLQYKEIITPSWRELDSVWEAPEKHAGSEGQRVYHSVSPQQPNGEGPGHYTEVEDLSDAVFLKRHAIWESRERSRWGSWARRRHRGRSSSSCGDGKSCRGSDQTPCSPEPRQGKSSPCRPSCSAADELFYQMEDEHQSVQSWDRRSFPLLEEELLWLQDDEEAELEEDACTASGRSQSTDSGISVGSLELSPRTPQPHQLHSEGHKPATSTQDSDSALPS